MPTNAADLAFALRASAKRLTPEVGRLQSCAANALHTSVMSADCELHEPWVKEW